MLKKFANKLDFRANFSKASKGRCYRFPDHKVLCHSRNLDVVWKFFLIENTEINKIAHSTGHLT